MRTGLAQKGVHKNTWVLPFILSEAALRMGEYEDYFRQLYDFSIIEFQHLHHLLQEIDMTDAITAPIVVVPPMPLRLRQFQLESTRALPSDGVRIVEMDDLIARADPHVSVGEDGMATISDQASEVLSPLELDHVRLLVSLHNAKPSQMRATSADRNVPLRTRRPPQALERCVESANVTTYWWGFRIYMNTCLCNDIKFIIAGGSTIISAVFALMVEAGAATAIGSVWLGLAVGIIVTMAAWIDWADNYCGNMGCNYNQTWTVQGWITTVC